MSFEISCYLYRPEYMGMSLRISTTVALPFATRLVTLLGNKEGSRLEVENSEPTLVSITINPMPAGEPVRRTNEVYR